MNSFGHIVMHIVVAMLIVIEEHIIMISIINMVVEVTIMHVVIVVMVIKEGMCFMIIGCLCGSCNFMKDIMVEVS